MKEKNHLVKKSKSNLPISIDPSSVSGLDVYLREIKKFPMLEKEEEYMLAKRFKDRNDVSAAHKLITSHLRLVAKIAMGYRGYGLPDSEIISEGNIGLMQAVKKFEPDKGFRLATYAMWWIKASIQEYVLRSWSLIKIGTTVAQKKLFFNLRKIKQKIGKFTNDQLNDDEIDHISSALDVSKDDVKMMEGRLSGDKSLNTPLGKGEESGAEWQDWLVDDEKSAETKLIDVDEKNFRKKQLKVALLTLKERERRIFIARRMLNNPKTLEELSKKYNISRERVRQIENRSFEKIQKVILENI